MVPSKSRQNFLYDPAMVSKRPYIILGLFFKVSQMKGNFSRAARF